MDVCNFFVFFIFAIHSCQKWVILYRMSSFLTFSPRSGERFFSLIYMKLKEVFHLPYLTKIDKYQKLTNIRYIKLCTLKIAMYKVTISICYVTVWSKKRKSYKHNDKPKGKKFKNQLTSAETTVQKISKFNPTYRRGSLCKTDPRNVYFP